MPQVVKRRSKLAKRVWQQIGLAKAQGTQFRIAKFKSYMDSKTGLRRQVEQHAVIKPWWFTTQTGKLAVSVRYDSRVLELEKNKFAVDIAAETDLIKTLDIIKSALLAGELDAQIDTAVTKLRAGFVK